MVSDELMRNFKTLLKLEDAAEQIYREHIEEFTDAEIRGKLEKIRKDEEGHVKLAKRMVSMLEEAAGR